MDAQPARVFQLGRFRLDLGRRRLTADDGSLIALSGRGYDVLAYLVENRHRVISKDELLRAIWPRVIVEENSLMQAISGARRALGDTRESPQFIATIAGRGYQFVGLAQPVDDLERSGPGTLPAARETGPEGEAAEAAVVTAEAVATEPPIAGPVSATAAGEQHPQSAARRLFLGGIGAAAAIAAFAWWRRRQSVPAIETIAVLPFKPLAASDREPAVELGVAELLINRLSSVEGVIVSPLSSVLAYAAADQDPLAAGRTLAVDAVVDGHVQIRDGRIRITARLLDTDDGRALWSGQFTEQMHDFFAVQDALANRIAAAVSSVAPSARPQAWTGYGTLDAEAWQFYAQGRFLQQRRTEGDLRRALTLFAAAQQRDPEFALAVAAQADTWSLMAVFGSEPTAASLTRAREAALATLAIDPDLPDGHAALGHVLTQFDRDFAGGRQQYRKALELDAEHSWSHALMALNLTQSSRHADALRHIRQAESLEPAAMHYLALGGWVQFFARQISSAERQLARLVQSDPRASLPRQFLGRVLLTRGDAQSVLRLLEGRNSPGPGSMSNLGRAYAKLGRIDDARAEIARVEELGRRGVGIGYELALVHLELGDRPAALAWLEKGLSDHSQMMGYLNADPALDPLREDPRFKSIAAQLRFD